MKRLMIVGMAALMLAGCGSSKYESEDDKLKAYTVNTAKSIRGNLHDAVNFELGEEYDADNVDAAKFRKAIPYIEAFKTDIDQDKLSADKKVLYEDLLRSLRPFEKLSKLAKADNDLEFSWAYEDLKDVEDFLEVAEYYEESYQNDNYKKLDSLKDY